MPTTTTCTAHRTPKGITVTLPDGATLTRNGKAALAARFAVVSNWTEFGWGLDGVRAAAGDADSAVRDAIARGALTAHAVAVVTA